MDIDDIPEGAFVIPPRPDYTKIPAKVAERMHERERIDRKKAERKRRNEEIMRKYGTDSLRNAQRLDWHYTHKSLQNARSRMWNDKNKALHNALDKASYWRKKAELHGIPGTQGRLLRDPGGRHAQGKADRGKS